ncbi:cation diffusion facilitator family transporter [Clostridium thermarum]|uniref:cation diffusion facilitator family transporter n=1 Tax=Clostridium thermarum TaxID=1716543 RepID=UPI0013D2D1E8|nr:cation diffusion facilitator family transporter [Clostridium thermarum]
MEGDSLKKVLNVLLIIFFANILVAALKIILGAVIESTSMMADGFHSLSDGSSNIVGLIGIWFASKPVDKDHPYGHSKFETLAGLFIGVMLSAVGINIIIGAVQRFINPVELSINLESIITLIITLVINIFVSSYEYKKGREYHSQILVSDSLHTRADIFVSVGVLATVIGIRFGAPAIIDPIASLIVAGFIFYAVVEIFRETSGVLVDKAVVDSERVKDVVTEFLEVKDVHHIRSRGTIDALHVDLHVMTDPAMSVEESHRLIHRIEDRLREEFSKNAQVIIHLEPYYYRAEPE